LRFAVHVLGTEVLSVVVGDDLDDDEKAPAIGFAVEPLGDVTPAGPDGLIATLEREVPT
jgi:hypothetical protein